MMMDEDRFWDIIDTSRYRAREMPRGPTQDFIDLHEQTLVEALRGITPSEVFAFRERFEYFHGMAYRWDLWAAAYWLHGGCSDDGFTDFRSCLISLGKERYFQVLRDPDSLADLVDLPDMPYLQAEGIQYVPSRVYEELTGEEMPEGDTYGPDEPSGERVDHDDDEVMGRHFPKLVARFPDMGD
jgi:hypothetical protein